MLNRARKALLVGAAVLAAAPGVAQQKNQSVDRHRRHRRSVLPAPRRHGQRAVQIRTRHAGVYPAALFDYIGVALIGITDVLQKLRNVRIKSAAR